MNEYDSSKISHLLNDTYGYKITNDPKNADILLLNTCSIREKAKEKVFHQLGRWKEFKKNKSDLIIGVGGCVASQEGINIFKRANYVDIIFGPQTLHRLPEMINKFKKNKNKIIDINFTKIEKFNFFPKPKAKGPVALISIMEGCNNFCSFCIVPYTRGREVSRSCDDILYEIFQLSQQGVREINLLGQNVNAYRGMKYNGKICSFSELLKLISLIDGIDRIRYITSNPIEFTDDIILSYKENSKLVNFVHLPIQSGSDKILYMMKRSHTVKDYKKIVYKLRKVRKNIQISSDFIVGFPGETQKDFEDTINLIIDINFDMSFSFVYSPRPRTPASRMKDNISLEEKKKRLYILQNVIIQQALKFSRRMLNTTQCILVEGISNKNNIELYGRTENNRIVNFKGPISLIGKFVYVKIIDIHNNLLKGIFLHDEYNI